MEIVVIVSVLIAIVVFILLLCRMNDMKKDYDLTVEGAVALRKRVEYEDQLLNSRTSIVLTLNGLMAVAAGLTIPCAARLAVAGVIIIVNLLWIPCAVEAHGYIKVLTLQLKRLLKTKGSQAIPIDECIRQEFLANRCRIGTTRFMSIIIPGLLLFGWVVALVLAK